MIVQDSLGETRGAGTEVNGSIIGIGKRDHRIGAMAIARKLAIVLGEGGTVVTHVEEQAMMRKRGGDSLDATDELGPEEKNVDIGQIYAVLDFIRGVTVVKRDGHGAGFKDAEINGQPFQAVHKKDTNLLALLDVTAKKQVCHAVRLLVECSPGNLPAESLRLGFLHQVVITPGNVTHLLNLGIHLNQCDVVAVIAGVVTQVIDDRHLFSFLRFGFIS